MNTIESILNDIDELLGFLEPAAFRRALRGGRRKGA